MRLLWARASLLKNVSSYLYFASRCKEHFVNKPHKKQHFSILHLTARSSELGCLYVFGGQASHAQTEILLHSLGDVLLILHSTLI